MKIVAYYIMKHDSNVAWKVVNDIALSILIVVPWCSITLLIDMKNILCLEPPNIPSSLSYIFSFYSSVFRSIVIKVLVHKCVLSDWLLVDLSLMYILFTCFVECCLFSSTDTNNFGKYSKWGSLTSAFKQLCQTTLIKLFDMKRHMIDYGNIYIGIESKDMVICSSHNKDIDCTLAKFHLFWLHSFYYEAGDYMFNALAVLSQFHYSTLEIRQGIVNHFCHCLDRGDPMTLLLLWSKLSIEILASLHNVLDVAMYLEWMCLSASQVSGHFVNGLWGDLFRCRHHVSGM